MASRTAYVVGVNSGRRGQKRVSHGCWRRTQPGPRLLLNSEGRRSNSLKNRPPVAERQQCAGHRQRTGVHGAAARTTETPPAPGGRPLGFLNNIHRTAAFFHDLWGARIFLACYGTGGTNTLELQTYGVIVRNLQDQSFQKSCVRE